MSIKYFTGNGAVGMLQEGKQLCPGATHTQSFVLLSNLSDDKAPILIAYTFNAK